MSRKIAKYMNSLELRGEGQNAENRGLILIIECGDYYNMVDRDGIEPS